MKDKIKKDEVSSKQEVKAFYDSCFTSETGFGNFKSVQSTLRIYATQSRDIETTEVFNEAVTTTEEIVKDLEARVRTLEFKEPQYKGK
mgnify:CR=1 FL=1